MKQTLFDRVIWVVLDGVGSGELPDAAQYGDRGANTLGNLFKGYLLKTGKSLNLPNLNSMGLSMLVPEAGDQPKNRESLRGAYGRAKEQSQGKDTTTGHWEMTGLILKKPFATFPDGFPEDIVNRWVTENNLPGVLGNKAASGTEIIVEFGVEHLKTGKPILYTSADSVWQIAAHEESFGLERLYSLCKSARKICDELQISRVIARPFLGNSGATFKRTSHRKDYSQLPPGPTVLDILKTSNITTLGIGKISAIFAEQGIAENISTTDNDHGIKALLEQMKNQTNHTKHKLIFCNLIDFDMLYGHRRDCEGFGKSMATFDNALPEIKAAMGPRDLLIITADHGNDPTFRGSDHTREYIPIFAYSPAQTPGLRDLKTRETFADIGATVLEALLGEDTPRLSEQKKSLGGVSFLANLQRSL